LFLSRVASAASSAGSSNGRRAIMEAQAGGAIWRQVLYVPGTGSCAAPSFNSPFNVYTSISTDGFPKYGPAAVRAPTRTTRAQVAPYVVRRTQNPGPPCATNIWKTLTTGCARSLAVAPLSAGTAGNMEPPAKGRNPVDWRFFGVISMGDPRRHHRPSPPASAPPSPTCRPSG
jgi:hypothetical protein